MGLVGLRLTPLLRRKPQCSPRPRSPPRRTSVATSLCITMEPARRSASIPVAAWTSGSRTDPWRRLVDFVSGMSRIICRRCGDRLSLVDDRWIHIGIPIAKAWTHPVQPVEAGSADDPGGAGAAVPARPYPPTLSSGAAAALTVEQDEPTTNAAGQAGAGR